MDPGFNRETLRKTNPSERFRVHKIRHRRREETSAEIQRGELESDDGEFEEV
jgi:xanthine dehydrogenase iron-sulfur cluster and FAD-binding subunit A